MKQWRNSECAYNSYTFLTRVTDGYIFLYALKHIGLFQATKLVCIGENKTKHIKIVWKTLMVKL